MSRRARLDLDYAILNKTGRRVVKNRDKTMAGQELDQKLVYIQSDIEDFFDSYDLNITEEESELEQYLLELGNLKRNFRRIYSESVKQTRGQYFSFCTDNRQ